MRCQLILCFEGHAKMGFFCFMELYFGSCWDQQMIGKWIISWLNLVSQCSRSRSVSRLSAACYARVRRMRASVLDSRAPCEKCDSRSLAPGRGGKQSGQFTGERGRGRRGWGSGGMGEKDGRPSESGEALKSPDTRQTISPSFCYLWLFCSRCPEGAGQGKSWPSVNTPAWKPLSGPDWLVLAEISSSPPPSPARAAAFCSLAGLVSCRRPFTFFICLLDFRCGCKSDENVSESHFKKI